MTDYIAKMEKTFEEETDKRTIAHKYGEVFEHDKWIEEIPYIPFPQGWEVHMTPPFGAKVARFRVREPGMTDHVSVYLDCYDISGCVGEPYWEIHRAANGDCERFMMNETAELVEGIRRALQVIKHPPAKVTIEINYEDTEILIIKDGAIFSIECEDGTLIHGHTRAQALNNYLQFTSLLENGQ